MRTTHSYRRTAAASAPAAFAVQEAVVVPAPSGAIFPDRADVGEPGRPGAALFQVRIEHLAQQLGHAAAFALRARFQGFVLPVVEEDLGALHVLHHTQQRIKVKADGPSRDSADAGARAMLIHLASFPIRHWPT